MNKAELVEAVATAAGIEKRQAEAAVGAFVDSVMSKTKSGEAVSVFGFGTFKPTARAARTGRNPQTGAAVKIAASKGVKFQPATAFKTTLNTRGAAKKTATKAAASKTTKATAKTTRTAAKSTTATTTRSAATKSAATKSAATKSAAKAPAKRTTAATKSPASKKVTATAKRATTVVAKAPVTKKVTATAKKAVRSTKKR